MRMVGWAVVAGLALAGCNQTAGTGQPQAADAPAAAMPNDQVAQAGRPPSAPPPRRNLKPADAVKEAQGQIAAKLKDPESARFTEVVYKPGQPNARGEPTDVVCGMVNAKNSFGGYTGAKPFVYFVDRRDIQLADGAGHMTDLARTIYRNFCEGGFAGRS